MSWSSTRWRYLISLSVTWISWAKRRVIVNIEGNTVADKLANEGRTTPSCGRISNALTPAELIAKFQIAWNTQIADDLTKYVCHDWIAERRTLGPRPWFIHKDWIVTRALFRLRSGHNGLRRCTSKIDKSLSSCCRHGWVIPPKLEFFRREKN